MRVCESKEGMDGRVELQSVRLCEFKWGVEGGKFASSWNRIEPDEFRSFPDPERVRQSILGAFGKPRVDILPDIRRVSSKSITL